MEKLPEDFCPAVPCNLSDRREEKDVVYSDFSLCAPHSGRFYLRIVNAARSNSGKGPEQGTTSGKTEKSGAKAARKDDIIKEFGNKFLGRNWGKSRFSPENKGEINYERTAY